MADTNEIRFTGILVECVMDRYGTWKVRFEVPASEKASLMALSEHPEKSLDIVVKPPTMDGMFGKVQE